MELDPDDRLKLKLFVWREVDPLAGKHLPFAEVGRDVVKECVFSLDGRAKVVVSFDRELCLFLSLLPIL